MAEKNVAKMSRPQRWSHFIGIAREALEELESLRTEYEDWKDNLPENLSSSTLADKLEEVVNLDVQTAIGLLDEADGLDLPRGFGRD